MKRPGICLYILSILILCYLSACSSGGSASGRLNCSKGGEVCIDISTVQSFSAGNPVPLKITVTSSKDISDLHVTLNTGTEITLDGTQTWENDIISNPTIDRGLAYWTFAIKADQSLTFNRVLHFPSHGGYFQIVVEAVTIGRITHAVDSFYFVLKKDGSGQSIMEGTPIPIYTPNVTSPAYGPGTPVPSPVTNPTYPPIGTPVPSLVTSPTPTPFAPLVATSTPLTSPYPPPPYP
jgi:hypothetical protein